MRDIEKREVPFFRRGAYGMGDIEKRGVPYPQGGASGMREIVKGGVPLTSFDLFHALKYNEAYGKSMPRKDSYG